MDDNHEKESNKRKLTRVRGFPGIFKIQLWSEEKDNFVDFRNVRGSKAKSYKAVRRVRVLGGKLTQQAKYFYTVDEARAWRNEVEPDAPKTSTPYFLRDLVRDWREWTKPPRMAASTWQIYEKDVPHYEPLFNVTVEELTAADIDGWLHHCSDPSYPKKNTRVSFRREVKTLTTVLNWYREYKNPLYRSPMLRRHLRDSFFKPRPAKEDISLSIEQVEDFLDHLRTHQKQVYFYLACCQALSGLRIGEACGLFWNCVDLKNAILDVRRVCYWDFKTKDPSLRDGTKTGEIRKVVIPPRLVQLLQEWKEVGQNAPYVFHREGQLIRYNMVQSAYKKAFRACGLPVRSTHVLRHTFASIFADQTNDIRGTQAAMGHKDLRVTQHYAKVAERTQRQAMAKFTLGNANVPVQPEPPEGGKVIRFADRRSK